MKKKIEALAFYLLAIGILVFLANVSIRRYSYITERREANAEVIRVLPKEKKERDVFFEVRFFNSYTGDSATKVLRVAKDKERELTRSVSIYYCKSNDLAFLTNRQEVNWGVFTWGVVAFLLMFLWFAIETRKYIKLIWQGRE